ncbi:alpha/beta hydrolase [Motiliproteus coralliicola]|uniref:Alpha/beta hydrolase n=1 Tax=Motiliproteus coralliicola TaxID=2283196 RepID=A0A369WC76_9GAMM|nr:alpha/beta hydrolase [Motiliproteus coralliicola]
MTPGHPLVDGPADAEIHLLLAHGAGAGMEHEFMQAIAEGLAAKGIRVIRFEFPYMHRRRLDGQKRPPDRMPKLLDSYQSRFEQQLAQLPVGSRLFVGGKSMGGRVASMLPVQLVEQQPDCATLPAGVICLGFPFHPPGKPEKYRGEHLLQIPCPTLIIQGERDTFGTKQELEAYDLGDRVEVSLLHDGDHSFKPRKASGTTLEHNLEQAIKAMVTFLRHHSQENHP